MSQSFRLFIFLSCCVILSHGQEKEGEAFEEGHKKEDESQHHIPKDMCKTVLNKFSETVADYTKCTAKFARPIELCLRCRDEYLAVQRAYTYMNDFKQDNISCKVVLTKQDRLGIIEEMYDFIDGPHSLWTKGSCKNCYESNDPNKWKANHTSTFESLWNETLECFRKYLDIQFNAPDVLDDIMMKLTFKEGLKDGELCTDCAEVYNKLRKFFWDKVVPSNEKEILSGVCYDLRDRFNLTGIIWKDTFDCEPKPISWKFMIPGIIAAVVILFLTYTCEPCILPWLFPKRIEERVNLVQQDVYDGEIFEIDDSDEIHGNFEVVPGVSAEEYITRFKEIEVSLPDGKKTKIRIPPPPEDFYDLEWDNDEWVMPPKDVFVKMHQIKKRFQDGEIDEREMDILQCRVIVEELEKKKKKKKNQTRSTQASYHEYVDPPLEEDNDIEQQPSTSSAITTTEEIA